MNKTRALYVVIFSALIIVMGALCVSEYVSDGSLSRRTVASAIGVLVASLVFLAKGLLKTRGQVTDLRVYESEFKKHIEKAFIREGMEKERHALLVGIDYFSRDEYTKAIKQLESLLPRCETSYDVCAVKLFLADCYNSMGARVKAIELYEDIVARNDSYSTAWSNMGNIYNDLGNTKRALDCLKRAVETDPENPYAYNNFACALVSAGAYDIAIPYAHKALELKTNFYQASNALAICYNAMSRYEEAERYFKISVSHGVKPEGLRAAMEKHKDAFIPYDEDEENDEGEEEGSEE